jgi:hypothetical protein
MTFSDYYSSVLPPLLGRLRGTERSVPGFGTDRNLIEEIGRLLS